MKKLVSSWYSSDKNFLPESYVFPEGQRPGNEVLVSGCKHIPIVDLANVRGDQRANTIQRILNAGHDYGLFQVIHHGVSKSLLEQSMCAYKDLFELPMEDKVALFSEDPNGKYQLYTSSYNYVNEKTHLWRDTLKLHCTPFDECLQHWPQKPANYREAVGALSREMQQLGLRILELISEGLKLDPGYFEKMGLSDEMFMNVNHYPPCPDPKLTLGLPRHCDPGLITILIQRSVPGLQLFKNGEWILVEPIPHALVVNIGCQLQFVSNGKLKAAPHRVVTNAKEGRISSGFFLCPSPYCTVEPADALVSAENPPLYKPFTYEDFLKTYKGYSDAVVFEAYKYI